MFYVEFISDCGIWQEHKELAYICRVQSSVWRLPNYRTIDPAPLSTQRVCPPPAPKAGGTHSPGGEGVGSQYFGRRQTLDWLLTVKSLYGQELKNAITCQSRPALFLGNHFMPETVTKKI
jgi:hypothetical protein